MYVMIQSAARTAFLWALDPIPLLNSPHDAFAGVEPSPSIIVCCAEVCWICPCIVIGAI